MRASERSIVLTDVERDHLLVLMSDAEQRGDYYGSAVRYWDRHDRIRAKLEAAPEPARAARPSGRSKQAAPAPIAVPSLPEQAGTSRKRAGAKR